jgi:hypothetical protein
MLSLARKATVPIGALCILVALLGALALNGCGGGSNPLGIGTLTFGSTTPTVAVGQEITLTPIAINSSGGIITVPSTNYSWVALTPLLATVSSAGVVTGVAPGQAQIEVTESSSGRTATVTVTVTAA